MQRLPQSRCVATRHQTQGHQRKVSPLDVFGQFVDHDLDLEETPTNSAPINIIVPPGDPVFAAGTSIAMTRDTRSPVTNTIVNTVAAYLDLSQLYISVARARRVT